MYSFNIPLCKYAHYSERKKWEEPLEINSSSLQPRFICITAEVDNPTVMNNNRQLYKMTIRNHKKNNFIALVRERTTPIKRPPLVGKVGVNFCG
jgi:hypothetical protein